MKSYSNYARYHKKVHETMKKGQQSASAIVRDVDPSTVRCPYCGGRMVVKPAGSLTHVKAKTDLLVCDNYPECDCYCSIYRKGNNKVRLKSTPANRKLRDLRREAHWYMNLLLDNKIFNTKDDLYWYFTDQASGNGLTQNLHQNHVGEMEEYGCQKMIRKCIEVLYSNKNRIKHFKRFKDGYSNRETELKEMLDEIETN